MFNDRSSGLLGMTADPGLVSLLASMEPKQRQHYVAQHSNDINVVIMGKVVSDIANKLEIAKKGAQPGTNSTVLAQTIASMAPEPQVRPQGQQQVMPLQGETQMAANGGYMDSRLPEEMGIGALPERSLSNMADGGIVGFKDEGLVQPAKTPAGRMFQGLRQSIDETNEAAELKNKLSQRYGTASALPGMFTEQSDAERENAKAIMGRLNSMSPTEMRFVLETGALPQGSSSFQPYDRNRKGNTPSNANATPATPPVAGGGAEDPNAPSGVPVARPVPRPVARPAAAAAAAARPTAGAPPAANAAATGIQTLVTKDLTPEDIADARKKFTEKQPAVVDTLKDQRQALVDEKNKNAEAEFTGFKERMAKQGDPYAKQEERANKQEAGIAESAERSPYLALMEAGFAMMAGDSPYAMVNIGKGALAGTKTYREGLALLEKAKEKLNETRDRIDGLRLIRSDLNDKEERDIQRETRRTALEGKTVMFDALEKLTGESKAQVENNVKMFMEAETARRLASRNEQLERFRQGEETTRAKLNASSQAGIAAANRATQEKIAGMPGATQQLILALGKGDIKEGYRLYNERPKQDDALFLDWSKRSEDPYTGEEFRKRYPTAQVYIEAARRNGTGVVDVETPLRTR